jgi:hypothetical protein
MSVKFRRAFGRTLSCGKNNGDSAYGRWAYGRGTHTTYTCASTALPSTSTYTYNAVNPSPATSKGPFQSRLNSRHPSSSSSSSKGGRALGPARTSAQFIPLKEFSPPTFTTIDLNNGDSTDAILPCFDTELEQLADPDEVTHLWNTKEPNHPLLIYKALKIVLFSTSARSKVVSFVLFPTLSILFILYTFLHLHASFSFFELNSNSKCQAHLSCQSRLICTIIYR